MIVVIICCHLFALSCQAILDLMPTVSQHQLWGCSIKMCSVVHCSDLIRLHKNYPCLTLRSIWSNSLTVVLRKNADPRWECPAAVGTYPWILVHVDLYMYKYNYNTVHHVLTLTGVHEHRVACHSHRTVILWADWTERSPHSTVTKTALSPNLRF